MKSEFSGSKDKKAAIDKSASSQDKIGWVKVDQNFEVNKEGQIDIDLDSDKEEQFEGGDKKAKSKPKEEKKGGGFAAGIKGKFGSALSGLKSSGGS